jgi:hypothetical protein
MGCRAFWVAEHFALVISLGTAGSSASSAAPTDAMPALQSCFGCSLHSTIRQRGDGDEYR